MCVIKIKPEWRWEFGGESQPTQNCTTQSQIQNKNTLKKKNLNKKVYVCSWFHHDCWNKYFKVSGKRKKKKPLHGFLKVF